MKRLSLFTILFGMFVCLFAQKPSLTRAYYLYYDKDFVKAKEVIDLCTTDEKMQGKAQTWLYKGNIYFYLANQEYGEKQQNSSYAIRFPDAPIEAYDAFIKAKELNKNVEGADMLSPDDALAKLYTLLLIRGVDQLIAQDVVNGNQTLQKAVVSYEMKTPPEHSLQGELYYYYAYSLELLHDTTQVQSYYEKAVQDGSTNVNVFMRLVEYYKKDDNKEKVQSLIEKAKQNSPNDPSVLVAEVDYNYWIGDKEKGKQLLANLPQYVFQNPDAVVNIANFYIKEGDYAKAESLLERANSLNPNNFVIIYNLGVCTYYLSEQYFAKQNEYEVAGNKNEANIVKTKADNYLQQAQSYFERAVQTAPDDLNILYTLKSIYARTQSPKYEEIEKKINSLEQKK